MTGAQQLTSATMAHPELYEMHRRTSLRVHAMPVMLWLLPHFAIPGGGPYRPPAASLFLLLWALFALIRPSAIRLSLRDPGALRQYMIWFVVYCLLSTFYGYWNLEGIDRLTLHLLNGDVDYLRVVSERLLQLLLVLVGFEVIRGSQHSSENLMRWWLQGTTVAVLFHAITYVTTSDPLLQRSGTFNEGNLAGLYYLLSVFVALEYRRTHSMSFSTWFLFVAVLGVILSRSTAGTLLTGLLLAVNYAWAAPSRKLVAARAVLMSVVISGFGVAMTSSGLDFGIQEKLFEEELTANSFSRIDRLESISAAIQLFADAPVLGQGLQTYGFLSNDLLEGPLLLMYDSSYRRIPNNIYAELAAELGLPGLLLFGGFLMSLISLVAQRGPAGRHALLGIVGVLTYWNAFPTYSVLFIWVYFGIVLKSVHGAKPVPAEVISASKPFTGASARLGQRPLIPSA